MNIIAKGVKGKEYLITEMIATRLNKKQFERLQKANKDILGGYRFIDNRDTDFSWWSRINKKLTAKKIISGCAFECDFYGDIKEY